MPFLRNTPQAQEPLINFFLSFAIFWTQEPLRMAIVEDKIKTIISGDYRTLRQH
ncbi:hypothetical protein X759_28850 [Mesorhizobium sp. LSHC420B00]|nr:hypothetical protein X759_28850 [Mesorhizobium sp. LSHC420B00]